MANGIKLLIATATLTTLTALTARPPMAAEVVCGEGEVPVPLSGKIYDNALQPGTTLGTVHLKLGREKLKCGILGAGGIGSDGSINFVHTVVCDDEFLFPPTGEPIHSQLSLNSTGYVNVQACPPGYPPGSTVGQFVETAVPMAGTGRGRFGDVETGVLHIEGSINCLASIDMTFDGTVCLKP